MVQREYDISIVHVGPSDHGILYGTIRRFESPTLTNQIKSTRRGNDIFVAAGHPSILKALTDYIILLLVKAIPNNRRFRININTFRTKTKLTDKSAPTIVKAIPNNRRFRIIIRNPTFEIRSDHVLVQGHIVTFNRFSHSAACQTCMADSIPWQHTVRSTIEGGTTLALDDELCGVRNAKSFREKLRIKVMKDGDGFVGISPFVFLN
ncbi:hypothetical protein HA402_015044 [Bradysia odoriphaga]|nr:hypothetical protein HA402_015044 [Bradysia odoriphaga]